MAPGSGIYFTDVPSSMVPRYAVMSLHWEAPYESQIRHKLGKMLASGYRHAGRNLGTPSGPAALVEFPVITAWGAAATPFCLLGDLFSRELSSNQRRHLHSSRQFSGGVKMTRAVLLLATICAVAASAQPWEVHWSEVADGLKRKDDYRLDEGRGSVRWTIRRVHSRTRSC